MPPIEFERPVHLIHSCKIALQEAMAAVSEAPEKTSLLRKLENSGHGDSYVTFTAKEAKYVRGPLLASVHASNPFGEAGRAELGKLAFGMVVDNLEQQFSPHG